MEIRNHEESEDLHQCAIFGDRNRNSLINRCPSRLVPLFLEVRRTMPKMIRLPEHSIRKKIKPTEQDDRLRLSFWDEYNKSLATDRKMNLDNVIRGACSYKLWVSHYEMRRDKLLWILTPPKSYSLAMKQILNQGLERLSEVVNSPIIDPVTGRPDYQVINQVIAIVAMLTAERFD